MPRDLQAEKDGILQGMPPLQKSPEALEDPASIPLSSPSLSPSPSPTGERTGRTMGKDSLRDQVRPYVQSLTLGDVESCVMLESVTFPPQEQCTREKVSRQIFASCRLLGRAVLPFTA